MLNALQNTYTNMPLLQEKMYQNSHLQFLIEN